MADNYLITGYWGEPHVTAENDRGINAAMFGTGRFVLPVGEQFKAEYIGNNTIRMYDGKLMDNGAAAGIPVGEYVDLLISNAGQGKKRNDLIVFQYEQDASTLIESGKFVVIQGVETDGTASDPALTQADLLSGEAVFDQMALWRVSVSGTTIAAPVKLFSVYQNTASHASDKSNPHGVTAEQVGAVKQGGGARQQHNKIYIGWTSENTLGVQVDDVDLGDIVTTVPGFGAIMPVHKGGTGAIDAAGARANLGAASCVEYTAVIPVSAWGDYGIAKFCMIGVDGMLASDSPIIDVMFTGTAESVEHDLLLDEEWGKIYRILAVGSGFHAWAREAPTVDLPVKIKVVR